MELVDLLVDTPAVRFTRGRIVIDNKGYAPFLVETHQTENIIDRGRATIINYDFQQLVTIAPMQGSVQTHIKNQKDYLLIPVPLNVSEADPITISKTTFDPTNGPSANFHSWSDKEFLNASHQ